MWAELGDASGMCRALMEFFLEIHGDAKHPFWKFLNKSLECFEAATGGLEE